MSDVEHPPPLQPHQSLKPSGVEWLADIPEHWEMRRGKTILRPIDVRSTTGREELLTVSAGRGVTPRRTVDVTMFKAESYVGHKLCWPGDLVINSLWAWAGGLGVARHHGIVSTAYGVYRPSKSVEPRFIHELVRSRPFHWELQVRSKGVWISRLQLTDEAFLGAPFPLPPREEQAAIVRYLGHVHRRVSRYIGRKRRLVSLLEEERRAVVAQAVTQGIDSDVHLKPSGVEWLGDVPEHWDLRRLRHFSLIQTGPFGSQLHADEYISGGIPIINPANVAGGGLVPDGDRTISHAKARDLARHAFKAGDIVFGRRGEMARVALVLPTDLPALCGTGCLRVEPNRQRVEPSFLLLALGLGALRDWLELVAVGSTLANLNEQIVGRIPVALPPLAEQIVIVEHLNRVTAKIEAAIARAGRQIELTEEYLMRLVADVVTGKLDVREAASRLPDEEDDDWREDASPADFLDGDDGIPEEPAEGLTIEARWQDDGLGELPRS